LESAGSRFGGPSLGQVQIIDIHPTTGSHPEIVALGTQLYVAADTRQGRRLLRYDPLTGAFTPVVDTHSSERRLLPP
jgi:hypothetical protein